MGLRIFMFTKAPDVFQALPHRLHMVLIHLSQNYQIIHNTCTCIPFEGERNTPTEMMTGT